MAKKKKNHEKHSRWYIPAIHRPVLHGPKRPAKMRAEASPQD